MLSRILDLAVDERVLDINNFISVKGETNKKEQQKLQLALHISLTKSAEFFHLKIMFAGLELVFAKANADRWICLLLLQISSAQHKQICRC